jgi:hypothetical protein
MRETVRRAINARPELTAELLRRGMFQPEEIAELLRCQPECSRESRHRRLGTVQLATLLAEGDSQFAARAVLRKMLDREELTWLDRLLSFQNPNGKRNELARIIERAMEGGKKNVRRDRCSLWKYPYKFCR